MKLFAADDQNRGTLLGNVQLRTVGVEPDYEGISSLRLGTQGLFRICPRLSYRYYVVCQKYFTSYVSFIFVSFSLLLRSREAANEIKKTAASLDYADPDFKRIEEQAKLR